MSTRVTRGSIASAALSQSLANTGRKRKRASDPKVEEDPNELPHNLGRIAISSGPKNAISTSETAITTAKITEEAKAPDGPDDVPATKSRRRAANPYGLTPGVTPFPEWPHPTVAECRKVNELLSKVHGVQTAPTEIPKPSLTVAGCGEVPSILDAMIRTRLSAATAGSNSNLAIEGLVKRFGILQDGIGKGSINWDAVRRADVTEVFKAIKAGGLGEVKSADIKAILEMVHSENQLRCEALIKAEQDDADAAPKGAENETPAEKNAEIVRAKENVLSLDHLHALEDNDAMNALVKYPGIGVKTASCVMLFCMRRPSFAVDTHVFRLLKWLKWVPPEVKNEIAAFKHVEFKVPNELKYSLHQLFIKHGRTCGRCRAATGETSIDWDKGCVIDHLVIRTGLRKGGVEARPGKKVLAKVIEGEKAAEMSKSVAVKKVDAKIQTGKKVAVKRGEKMKKAHSSAEDQDDLSALSDAPDEDDNRLTETKTKATKVTGKKVDAKKRTGQKVAATRGVKKKQANSVAEDQNNLSALSDAPDEEGNGRLTETKTTKIKVAGKTVDAKKVTATRGTRKKQVNSVAEDQNNLLALSDAPDEEGDGRLTETKTTKIKVAGKKVDAKKLAATRGARKKQVNNIAEDQNDLSALSEAPEEEDDDRLTETKTKETKVAGKKVDAKKRTGKKVATTRSVRQKQINSTAEDQNDLAPDVEDGDRFTEKTTKRIKLAGKNVGAKKSTGKKAAATRSVRQKKPNSTVEDQDDFSPLSDAPDKEDDDRLTNEKRKKSEAAGNTVTVKTGMGKKSTSSAVKDDDPSELSDLPDVEDDLSELSDLPDEKDE